jgi:serine/threonine protein kinase
MNADLPPDQGASPTITDDHIEAICRQFERAWKSARTAAEGPSIEQFLSGSFGSERKTLLAELLMLELEFQGRPHIADFGLAIHGSAQRLCAGEHSGTLPCMAPEQVRGETHRLDGRADVWALGVTLYEMLAGRRPFDGDNPDAYPLVESQAALAKRLSPYFAPTRAMCFAIVEDQGQ